MKLNARDIASYVAKPDPTRTGALIYGQDAMRVALRRQALIKSLLGPTAEEEMRLTRMSGADLRKDKTLLTDAIKAVGFFPGPSAVLVEDANDAAFDAITFALAEWADGDAQIVVTAGGLAPKSKVRKAFEAHSSAYAIAIYNDPPSREEIEALYKKAGLRVESLDAREAMDAYSKSMDPGDFQQFVEKLSLYTLDADGVVDSEAVEAVAPASTEAALDELVNAVAEARSNAIGPLSNRLSAQGTSPTAICIAMLRHFRTLFTAATHPGGAAEGLSRMYPPVFGPRRNRMQKQVQMLGRHNLERALTILLDVDLKLRSAGQTAPQMAMVERYLIRIAMIGGNR